MDGYYVPESKVKRGFGHSNDGVGLPVFRGRKPNNMGSHETGVAYGIEEVFAPSMTQVIDQLGSQGGEGETRASGGVERCFLCLWIEWLVEIREGEVWFHKGYRTPGRVHLQNTVQVHGHSD